MDRVRVDDAALKGALVKAIVGRSDMEEVCERENLLEALRRVKGNKGSAWIDGMTIGQLSGYLKEHWLTIRGTTTDRFKRRIREITRRAKGVSIDATSVALPKAYFNSLGLPNLEDER